MHSSLCVLVEVRVSLPSLKQSKLNGSVVPLDAGLNLLCEPPMVQLNVIGEHVVEYACTDGRWSI
jgi:hypothetical protein